MIPPLSWPFDPTVYAGLAIFSLDYVLLARGRGIRARHGIWFALGVLTLWVALETPIDTLGDHYLMSVHMVQHVLLLFVAPPLLLLGLTPKMAATLLRIPPLRWLTRPWPAQIVAGAVLIAWHLPPLYDATLRSETVHILEHVTFIATGLLWWWPALRATSSVSGVTLGEGWKLVYLFAGTLPQDAVALPLMFSRVTFYAFYDTAPRLVSWLTPSIDQDIAGAVMMLAAKVGVLVAMLVIFFRWAAREQAADRLGVSADQAAGRPVQPVSSGPPA